MRRNIVYGLVAFLVSGLVSAMPGQAQTADMHNGPASCASRGCHGATQAYENGLRVDGNEHTIWLNGPHATSYRTLTTPKAEQIARNLGLGLPTQADMCLNCHATNIPPSQQGPDFNISDGVTCEACHGGSGRWLDQHQAGLDEGQLTSLGMFPTFDPVQRADMCLDCHFGREDNFAGHRLMGAGHPRLSFELDSYTEGETVVHHTVDQDYLERHPKTVGGLRTWAIGQAVSTERRMSLLASARTGTNGFFPEFVFFDCHSCHQPMSVKRRNSVNKRGQPRFDDAHMQMLQIALNIIDPVLADRLAGDTAALHRSAARNRGALVGAAEQIESTAEQSLGAIGSRGFSGAEMRDVMRTIASRGANGQFAEFAAAEQATMAIGTSIYAMWSANEITDAEYDLMNSALAGAWAAVASDDRYSPGRFAAAMQSFNAALQ